MSRILIQSILTTLTFIIVSLLVMRAFGVGLAGEALWLPIISSVFCAWPASMFLFHQNQRLRKLNTRLEQTNASLEIAHAALSQKVNHDAMTGFLNREAFLAKLDQTRRASDRGILLIVDADHFKQINDEYGHLKGDQALMLITGAIRSAVRDGDHIGRIGGEEFAIYLKGASLSAATEISERLRNEVERLEFIPRDDRRHPLTVSIGGAICQRFAGISDLMTEADARLYAAKHAGRNRVSLPSHMALAA